MITDVANTTGRPAQLPSNPGGNLGKDEFLKMLVAQLQNQDPMNPMNGDDMAAQLAQFSSLEQLTNIGEALEAQAGIQEGVIASIHDTTAMNVIGKEVLAAGDQLYLEGDGTGTITVQVGEGGGLGRVRIFNAAGSEVGSSNIGFVAGGRHELDIDSAVKGLPEGEYYFSVEVADGAGNAVPAQTFVRAKIDGVTYGADGPVLTSGRLQIPFATILQVSTR